jgi:predicted branched-subunit amino acid permease
MQVAGYKLKGRQYRSCHPETQLQAIRIRIARARLGYTACMPESVIAVPPTTREAFNRGMRELLPAGPGVIAWGLVTGVAMVKSGLSVTESIGLSLLAYAGSAQLAALPLIASIAPWWLVFVTALIVNLRFVVYSAAVRPYFQTLPTHHRVGLGYIIGDIMFVKFTNLLQTEPRYARPIAYYCGGAACNWLIWQVASIAGILLAKEIPATWGLELAGTLALIALLVPLCRAHATLVGAVVSATVAVLAHDLPLRLGLLLALLAGMTAAFWADRKRSPSQAAS